MLPDETIIKSVTGMKKAVILTCPGCACESLSYDKQLPNRSLVESKGFENSAIAVHHERDRIVRLLDSRGIMCDMLTAAFPCELLETERERIVQKAQGADAVCVLACTGGFIGIRDILGGFGGKIVPLMKTAGTFVFHLKADAAGQYSMVERDNARILRFSPLP
jgi:hypothetical protein